MRSKQTRLATFFLCGLVALTVPSCHQKKDKISALHLNIYDQPNSFDPRIVRNIKDLTIAKQLYEGLMRFDQDNHLAPALATKVEVSEDGCTYTFALREAYWSNGEMITAYDFERSCKELLSPEFPTAYAPMLFSIKNAKLAKLGECSLDKVGISVADQKTLIIHLEKITPYFLELTAFPTYFPFHKDKSIYSGPFKIKKMEPEYLLVLEKNPYYWDQEKVQLDEIHFSMIADPVTESLLYEKGELDWLGQPLSNALTHEFLSHVKKVNSYPVAGTLWLTFNHDVFPYTHVKMRKALNLAINRKDLIAHILQGGQEIATSPIPPFMNHHNPYFLDNDITNAQKLLAELYEECSIEHLPPLTLTFGSTQRNRQLAQVIQNQLQDALGITVHLQALEQQFFRQQIKKGAFEIAFGQWVADFNDPITFLELFTLPREYGLNDANWQSAPYIALLEQASLENNSTKRLLLLEQAEQILMEEMPIAPLYHYAFDYMKKENVKNVVLSPFGLADFKYATIK